MILGFFALKRRGIITRSTAVCQSMRLLTAGSLVRVQLGEPKNPLSTVGVDDAGGPPRVLADFAH